MYTCNLALWLLLISEFVQDLVYIILLIHHACELKMVRPLTGTTQPVYYYIAPYIYDARHINKYILPYIFNATSTIGNMPILTTTAMSHIVFRVSILLSQ